MKGLNTRKKKLKPSDDIIHGSLSRFHRETLRPEKLDFQQVAGCKIAMPESVASIEAYLKGSREAMPFIIASNKQTNQKPRPSKQPRIPNRAKLCK